MLVGEMIMEKIVNLLDLQPNVFVIIDIRIIIIWILKIEKLNVMLKNVNVNIFIIFLYMVHKIFVVYVNIHIEIIKKLVEHVKNVNVVNLIHHGVVVVN